MPHPKVDEWFKQKAVEYTDVPYQDTQSAYHNRKDLPEVWCTLEYDPGSTQRLSVGVPALYREYGTATIVFLGKSGKGIAALLRLAQSAADALRDAVNERIEEDGGIVGTLRLENVGPPSPEPYEDGAWVVCSVACVYTYDSVRGAAMQSST